MARVPLIKSREQLPPNAHAAYDSIAATRGAVAGPFEVLLHSPALAQGVADLGTFIRYGSTLPDRVRELAIVTAGRELDALYIWASHIDLARKAGLPEPSVDRLRAGQAPDGLSDDDAAVVRFVQQLIRKHRVEAGVFESLKTRLGEKGVLELAGTVGYYSLMAAALNTFEVEPAPGMDLLPVQE